MTKNFEKTIPIKWKYWDENDNVGVDDFYDVEFTENFGIFDKGDKFDVVSINHIDGIIKGYDKDGLSTVKTQEVVYTPKPISGDEYVKNELIQLSLKFPDAKFKYKKDFNNTFLIMVEPHHMYMKDEYYSLEESEVIYRSLNNRSVDVEMIFMSDFSLCAFSDPQYIVENGKITSVQ